MQRVTITTLGCRLNQFESDALERLLSEGGYTIVDGDATADVHILNTCTITHHADQEARYLVRRIHRDHPEALIVITGCYATIAAKAARELPGVRLVVSNGAKAELVQRLKALNLAKAVTLAPRPAARSLDNALPVHPGRRRSRAYLKVQDGCDYRCAFCIVPEVRGRSRSLPPSILVQQMRELVDAGVPEVVVTGVHLGTYGRDLTPRLSLGSLLRTLLPELRNSRLRLSSVDPHEVDKSLIELFQQHAPRLCRYLHLPVQSADNTVLRRMRRAHTAEDFITLVPNLVRQVPGIGLGSDVIVGFPQETEAQFEHTYDVLEALPLAYLHVFSYSPRHGTAAAEMQGHVKPSVIATRSKRLRALSARKRVAFMEPFVGSHVQVVVHRVRHRSGDCLGVTDNFIKVRFARAQDDVLGRTVDLRLVAAGPDGARGVLV